MRPVFSIIVLCITVLFLTGCAKKDPDFIDYLKDTQGDEWVLKVGDITLYKEDFTREFLLEFKFSGLPSDFQADLAEDIVRKEEYLDMMKNQYQILLEAEKQNIVSEEDFKPFLRSKMREAVFYYYAYSVVGRDVKVEDSDVEDFYTKHRNKIGELNKVRELEIRQLIWDNKLKAAFEKHIAQLNTKVDYNKESDLYDKDSF